MNQVVTQWMQIDLASKITWPDLLTQVVRKFKIISAWEKKIEKEKEERENKDRQKRRKDERKKGRKTGRKQGKEEENCIKLNKVRQTYSD